MPCSSSAAVTSTADVSESSVAAAPAERGQLTCTKLAACPHAVASLGNSTLGLAVASSAANQASSAGSAIAAGGSAATSATGPRAKRSESQVTGVPSPTA